MTLKDDINKVIDQHDKDDQEMGRRMTALTQDVATLTKLSDGLAQERDKAVIDAGDWRAKYEALLAEQEEVYVPKFPGDLGPGKYRVGWSLERGTASGWDLAEVMAQPWWAEFGDKISIIHDYSAKSNKFLDKVSAQAVINAGFKVVSQSCKLLGVSSTFLTAAASFLNGSQDTILRTDGQFMKDNPNTVFEVTVYHEPEDLNTAQKQKALCDVTRYIAVFLKAMGVGNVVFSPVYQVPWTFRAGATDPRVWHPDWTGTAWNSDRVCPTFGGDVYNPLPPSGGKVSGPNREFADMWQTAIDRMAPLGLDLDEIRKDNKEFGMGRINTTNAEPPGGWLRWAQDCRITLEAGYYGSLCYWDNSDDIGRYRLTNPSKMEGWKHLCAGATV